jgi:phosphatidylinositol glycan class P protein
MPPQSRGGSLSLNLPHSPVQSSKSSPNLPTLRDFNPSKNNRKKRTAVTSPLAESPASTLLDDSHPDKDVFMYDGHNNVDQTYKQERISLEHPRPPMLRSSASNIYLQPSPSQLFPPFYGRPTTPLPPSPSLTSLLRPPFSTHTSHHTTPESSDVESQGGAASGSTAGLVEKSAQTATTVPRASPKVPTYEYYGFALYLASSFGFLMYLLWAFLPSPFLHQLGIYYYPNRWWALAVPAWLVVSVGYIYVALASFNTGYLTLPMESIENMVDEAANIAIVDKYGHIIRPKKISRFADSSKATGKHSRQSSLGTSGRSTGAQAPFTGEGADWRHMWAEGTDAVMDIPIGGVCEILYGAGRQLD